MNINSTLQLRTGRYMPVLGLGTWNLKDDTAGTITMALKMGYPMIDTSGDYGTQPGIGTGIDVSGKTRESFYLVTKVEEDENAYESARQNLEELKQDYADLILIHRPPSDGAGEELWEGLIRARTDGLTKDIGVSNYSIEHIQTLIDATGEVPVVNQIEWSPFGWSKEMVNFCKANNIVIMAYSPLAQTQRSGDRVLSDLSSKYEKSPAQIMIRWCLQIGTVPIPKANQLKHLEENLDVFDFEIKPDDMAKLNDLNEEYSALSSSPIYMQQ